MYRQFRVRKPKGGFRTITEPLDNLKRLLVLLKAELEVIPLDPCVHGFVPGKSTLTNAIPHRGNRYVLNVDIKSFFPSVKKELMMKALQEYKDLLNPELLSWIDSCCFYQGELPQGSPASPVLANIYAAQFDQDMKDLAVELGCNYTRYADDLTFSGGDILKTNKDEIVTAIAWLLRPLGLKLNPKKIKLMPYYQRQLVTGVVVNNERLTLARTTKEEIFLSFKGRVLEDLDESEFGLLKYVEYVDWEFYKKVCKNMCLEGSE